LSIEIYYKSLKRWKITLEMWICSLPILKGVQNISCPIVGFPLDASIGTPLVFGKEPLEIVGELVEQCEVYVLYAKVLPKFARGAEDVAPYRCGGSNYCSNTPSVRSV
jgi:hypothetical protein